MSDKSKVEQEEKRSWMKRIASGEAEPSSFLIALITALISLPVFILVYSYVPTMRLPFGEGGIRIDHFLTFIAVFIAIYILVKKLRIFVYAACVIGLAVLTYTNFTGTYGLKDLYHDYSTMLYSLQSKSEKINFSELQNVKFSGEEAIKIAVDYKSVKVRTLGANYAIANFQDYEYLHRHRKTIQYFSIFKEVKQRWNYVYDPAGEDYYAMASETVDQLQYDDKFKGDCDDYSILIGGLIKSIGGEVRLVRTKVKRADSTEIGHLYPEVKIGDGKELEAAIYLIKAELFHKESKGKPVYYYKDPDGYVWLNFDYNDDYPGGKYQSLVRESALTL